MSDDDSVTIVRSESEGKAGSRREVHYLSNGWEIYDLGTRGQRAQRFSLYRPGVGGSKHHTLVKGGSSIKALLLHATQLQKNQLRS